MAATYEKWACPKPNSIASLQLQKATLEPPKVGEIQVDVKAVGLNFADIFACKGLYAAAPKTNMTPGFEASGVVAAVNYDEDTKVEESQRFNVGDRVVILSGFGSYVTKINVPASHAFKIKDEWSFQQAAAFPVQALTAFYALYELANTKKGATVLIHSAAGGVGQLAVRMCQHSGAKVIATIGSPKKMKYLVDTFGLDEKQIIVRASSEKEFTKQLDAACEFLEVKGPSVVLDAVSGVYFMPAYKKMVPRGRHIIYGSSFLTNHADGGYSLGMMYKYLTQRPKLDVMNLIGANKSVMGFNLVYLIDDVEFLRGAVHEILDMKLPAPHVGEEFDFTDALAALRRFQSGQTVGKVVLVVKEPKAEEAAKEEEPAKEEPKQEAAKEEAASAPKEAAASAPKEAASTEKDADAAPEEAADSAEAPKEKEAEAPKEEEKPTAEADSEPKDDAAAAPAKE